MLSFCLQAQHTIINSMRIGTCPWVGLKLGKSLVSHSRRKHLIESSSSSRLGVHHYHGYSMAAGMVLELQLRAHIPINRQKAEKVLG